MKERHLGTRAAKNARKERYFSTPTEELKCQVVVDKITRTYLADDLRELKKISDESVVLLEQERLQEEDVWKIVRWPIETWETTQRTIVAITEKVWKLSQRSDTKGNNLEQDWGSFMNLAKEHGWTRDPEDMAKVWMARK